MFVSPCRAVLCLCHIVELHPVPEGRYVWINDQTQSIWTISLNASCPGTPLVLLHGMGSGVALWALNLPGLAARLPCPIYAIDLLGFGRSSRTRFSDDAAAAELQFVESIEAWRAVLDLPRMVLLGHSFGGFLATAYSLRYGGAGRVEHLILADPWGFDPPLSPEELRERMPRKVIVLRCVYNKVNPFGPLRLFGPIGEQRTG